MEIISDTLHSKIFIKGIYEAYVKEIYIPSG